MVLLPRCELTGICYVSRQTVPEYLQLLCVVHLPASKDGAHLVGALLGCLL